MGAERPKGRPGDGRDWWSVSELIRVDNSPGTRLVTKLRAWCESQPEWVLILAMSRQQRRQAMRLIAAELTRIPSGEPGVGRKPARDMVKKLKKANVPSRGMTRANRRDRDRALTRLAYAIVEKEREMAHQERMMAQADTPLDESFPQYVFKDGEGHEEPLHFPSFSEKEDLFREDA